MHVLLTPIMNRSIPWQNSEPAQFVPYAVPKNSIE